MKTAVKKKSGRKPDILIVIRGGIFEAAFCNEPFKVTRIDIDEDAEDLVLVGQEKTTEIVPFTDSEDELLSFAANVKERFGKRELSRLLNLMGVVKLPPDQKTTESLTGVL